MVKKKELIAGIVIIVILVAIILGIVIRNVTAPTTTYDSVVTSTNYDSSKITNANNYSYGLNAYVGAYLGSVTFKNGTINYEYKDITTTKKSKCSINERIVDVAVCNNSNYGDIAGIVTSSGNVYFSKLDSQEITKVKGLSNIKNIVYTIRIDEDSQGDTLIAIDENGNEYDILNLI